LKKKEGINRESLGKLFLILGGRWDVSSGRARTGDAKKGELQKLNILGGLGGGKMENLFPGRRLLLSKNQTGVPREKALV